MDCWFFSSVRLEVSCFGLSFHGRQFFSLCFGFLQANKMENPSSSSSLSLGNQQPVGVIVKYDTSHKLNPIQLTHSNVEKVKDFGRSNCWRLFFLCRR